jgi:hypothetical protein
MNRVARLLLQDSVPTLGERARAEVRRLAANYEALAREWIADGSRLGDAQRSVDQNFVDALQQTAHDLFWDTSWPACPRHPRHPLWYEVDSDAWWCAQDQEAIAPLGALANIRPPAT